MGDDLDPVDCWKELMVISGPVDRPEPLKRGLDACNAIGDRTLIAVIRNLRPIYLPVVDIRIAGGRWRPASSA